ncbi:hypothetical protein JST56_06555 [Candidatus Dependentiae bacterium]|jgi:hypothetical protein|nr:hypothetical protein [Candidatus Dependentiae bacterium]
MIQISLYSILFVTALTSSTLIGMQSNIINHDEISERITLHAMGFSQENIDKLFKSNCTLETVQQLLGLDMSVQEIIDQFSATLPQHDVAIQNQSSDPDGKNEMIEDNVEEESSKGINQVIIGLNTMGYPLGTINWWQTSGYNLDTIFELRKAGIPLQEILNIFEKEDQIDKDEWSDQISSHINLESVKLKRTNNEFTRSECTQEQKELQNELLRKVWENFSDEELPKELESDIIMTENHDSNFQESTDNQKPVKPKLVKMRRSENFCDISEVISEDDILNDCIQRGKDAYEKAIKPGLEHMQFDLKTHTTTFLTFAEEMTFYLLDRSGITDNANQKHFGLQLIEAILDFYAHQMNRTRITFQNVQNKLNLSKIFSPDICLDQEAEIFRTIAFEHVDQTFLAFDFTFNNLKLENQVIKAAPQPLEKLYPLLVNAISQALQLKFECMKILQSYTSNNLVSSAAQQISTSGKTIEWLVKNLLTHTFDDEGIEIECLIGFNEKMNSFKSMQYASYEELEKDMCNLQTVLDEMFSAWLHFSQELKTFNEFE